MLCFSQRIKENIFNKIGNSCGKQRLLTSKRRNAVRLWWQTQWRANVAVAKLRRLEQIKHILAEHDAHVGADRSAGGKPAFIFSLIENTASNIEYICLLLVNRSYLDRVESAKPSQATLEH